MPHLLFRLNGVPDDEAEEVRALLVANHIDFYETDAGRFGISLAAIWLRDDGEPERARALLDRYQQQRFEQARARYEQQLRDGTAESQLQRLMHQPLRSLIFLLALMAVLALSTLPFIMWWR
jgi:hypothetical protein